MTEKSLWRVFVGALPCTGNTLCVCGTEQQCEGPAGRGGRRVLAAVRTAFQRVSFISHRGTNFALHCVIFLLLHLRPSVGQWLCLLSAAHRWIIWHLVWLSKYISLLLNCFLVLIFYTLYTSKCISFSAVPRLLHWTSYYWWQLHGREERRKIPHKKNVMRRSVDRGKQGIQRRQGEIKCLFTFWDDLLRL